MSRQNGQAVNEEQGGWKRCLMLLFLLGMVSLSGQLVLIREFISVLEGNELIVGVVMAVWMLLTGLGARWSGGRSGRDRNMHGGFVWLLVLALLPAMLIAVLYWLMFSLLPPGKMAGPGTALAGIVVLLFPLCFLSGALFPLLAAGLSRAGRKNRTGRAYAWECWGSLAGGLLTGLLLFRYFGAMEVGALMGGTVCMAGALINRTGRLAVRLGVLLAAVLIPFLFFRLQPGLQIKKLLYPGQEILLDQPTPYGNLTVTRQAGQLNFYENHSLQFYTDNRMLSEESVHYAMLRHGHPRKLLLISGGISGMIGEAMKYPLEQLTYLEPDPAVYTHWKELTYVHDERKTVRFVPKDIRTYLQQTPDLFDVVLINLPPPSSLGINRFYTSEFFELLKGHCTEQTVVCTSLPAAAGYADREARAMQASLWNTLGRHFRQRLLVPGERFYFLASDSCLTYEFSEALKEKELNNSYVNSYYMEEELLARRARELVADFDTETPVNRDFFPFMFIRQTAHWLSHFRLGIGLVVGIPVLLFVAGLFRLGPVTAGLYLGGFGSAAMEVILLLAYQVYFGSIYLSVSLFFGVFMGGLALGSRWKGPGAGSSPGFVLGRVPYYAALQFLQALLCILLPALVLVTGRLAENGLPVKLLFFLPVFVLSFVYGQVFNRAAALQTAGYRKASAVSYSTDLAGSALGAFLAPLLLLPVTGLCFSCLIAGMLNLGGGLWAMRISR
ncbi:MAG: spermidine synthase [Mangrovibacterium sp.]